MSAVIHVENIEKVYRRGNIHALKGISFEIEKGETFGLLGPNGAGKSTAIGILITIIELTAGKASILGMDVTKEPNKVKALLGVVPQDRWLDEDLTARENLLIHGKCYGMGKAERKTAAERVLGMMELSQRADDNIRTYSGGMLQRLLIARAIMHEPQILIMDEPTIGLDPQARRHMWQYIEQLKRQGVTILMTTHYMEEADVLCDRVAIIDEGVIKAIDTPEKLKSMLPGGNTVIAEAKPIDKELLKELRSLKNVSRLTSGDESISLFVKDGKRALPLLVTTIQKYAELHSITLHEPTLEDVYISLTGKELRE